MIGSASLTVSTGTWYTLRIDADGSTISGYVNGTRVGSGSNSAHSAGRIGLVTVFASARFDDVVVSTIGSTPPTVQPDQPAHEQPDQPADRRADHTTADRPGRLGHPERRHQRRRQRLRRRP